MNVFTETNKKNNPSTSLESFRDYCYGKYILSRIAMELPLDTVLSLMNEWKGTKEDGDFLWFLNSKGILLPVKEHFLENEYQDTGYLAGILTEDEMRTWVSLEHPDFHEEKPSMAYADAKSLLKLCIAHGVLEETRAIRVVSVYKGNMVSNISSLEDCTQSLMYDREGQEELKNALMEKGISFQPQFGFLVASPDIHETGKEEHTDTDVQE